METSTQEKKKELEYLIDSLLKEMSQEQAMLRSERFTKAMSVDADLSKVVAKLTIWQFEDDKHGLKNIKEVKKDRDVYRSYKQIVALYKRSLTEEVPKKDYNQLYLKIDTAWARTWTWAWTGAVNEADYKRNILIITDKLIALIEEEDRPIHTKESA